MKFKECPRCNGDLKQDNDRFGSFFTCLQCGYIKEVGVTNKQQPAERPTSRNKVANQKLVSKARHHDPQGSSMIGARQCQATQH